MSIAPQKERPLQPVRWTRAQYHQMGDLGWFEGMRVELIEGQIVEISPIGRRHWSAVNYVSADTIPVLFVEVADSSLAYDRHAKQRVYARNGTGSSTCRKRWWRSIASRTRTKERTVRPWSCGAAIP